LLGVAEWGCFYTWAGRWTGVEVESVVHDGAVWGLVLERMLRKDQVVRVMLCDRMVIYECV